MSPVILEEGRKGVIHSFVYSSVYKHPGGKIVYFEAVGSKQLWIFIVQRAFHFLF